MEAFQENGVIITGASTGIGEAMAYQLAEQGAWLALAARSETRLNSVADECRKRGGRALVVQTDVADQTQCEALVAATVKEYGRVDMLINNAGIAMWARFDAVQDLAIFEKIIRVNYLGSLYCTHYALLHLKQTRGRIVGVSSLAGKTGVPKRSGYVAGKHAMTGFFDTLRIELADQVSVTMAYPDFVLTGGRMRNVGADGKPVKDAPSYSKKTMSAETCARLILRAAARREREIIMGTRGKVGLWLKLIAPGWVDRIARRASERGR